MPVVPDVMEIDRHTDTQMQQTKYRNPRCACTRRGCEATQVCILEGECMAFLANGSDPTWSRSSLQRSFSYLKPTFLDISLKLTVWISVLTSVGCFEGLRPLDPFFLCQALSAVTRQRHVARCTYTYTQFSLLKERCV